MINLKEYFKNKSLAVQIWIAFVAIISFIFLVLTVMFSFSLRNFFTDEVYNTIEASQNTFLGSKHGFGKNFSENEDIEKYNIREVKHLKYPFPNDYKIEKLFPEIDEREMFLNNVIKEYNSQKEESKRYVIKLGHSNLFYVITKYETKNKKGFVLSYMWDTYRNNILRHLMNRLIVISIISIIVSLLVAIKMSNYLTKPLRILESNVKKIAKKQWNNNVDLNRNDEIGSLSKSIEYMRRELVKSDETQQRMLQNISHELKTPVMVIRSYAQAVEDGIYPKGDINSTMKVIDKEAERLEKGIKNLIYLTKLEYMSGHETTNTNVNLKETVISIVEKFAVRNNELKINLELDDVEIWGNLEQWNVVIENLLDNAFRYAEKFISIRILKNSSEIILRFYNDGEGIKENEMNKVFKCFCKGQNGNFGLGLTIVKQIIDLYNGEVWCDNEDDGVAFYIKLYSSKLIKI